ncbi:MAG: hypothetical protein HND47_20960 [Chloroflexi bacterium]|nr:hypothetical protein [Chloroflexota bacterium]
MAALYKFLASYEVLIYILLAIGGMFSFRWLWRSWREWRIAVFTLEREFSARRLGRSVALSVIVVMLFCAEFFMATFFIPGLPADFFYRHAHAGFHLHAHRHAFRRDDDPVCKPAARGPGRDGGLRPKSNRAFRSPNRGMKSRAPSS